MNIFLRTLIFFASFMFSESFLKPMLLRKPQIFMASKHNFNDFARSLSLPDKYFLIQSLINHIVLKKQDLLFDYCYKNLNQTDVMHITISSDLEDIVKKHYSSKTTLQQYNAIKTNAQLTDCYMKIYNLKDLENIKIDH